MAPSSSNSSISDNSWAEAALSFSNSIIEKHVVPDLVLRRGIRKLLSDRLEELAEECRKHSNNNNKSTSTLIPPIPSRSSSHANFPIEGMYNYKLHFVEELRKMPIAVLTDKANEQHYEVPTEYYDLALGPRKKYSSCFYPTGNETLAEAENFAFEQVVNRADLSDNMKVVDLGCGWGSLTLFLLEKFPNLQVTSVSNSRTQKIHIEAVASEKNWSDRLTVLTQDANYLDLPENSFDRVLSIEMFEHMKNYGNLMRKISNCLKKTGKLFVHIFTHRELPYHFEDNDKEGDWMARYFFSGGTMPSADLLHFFCGEGNLLLEKQWANNGNHYSKTLEDWLKLQDQNEGKVKELFKTTYGTEAIDESEKKTKL